MNQSELFASIVDRDALELSIVAAVKEDMGIAGDITTDGLVPVGTTAAGVFRAREDGIVCGVALLEMIAEHYGESLVIEPVIEDGQTVKRGEVIARISGKLREVLKAERLMLNYMSRLSGIATLTGKYVEAVAGSVAKIYDTRKTTPGLRQLEKYAVRCGGGESHRMGLYDAMLVKDNHIAHIPADKLGVRLNEAIGKVRWEYGGCNFVEVEVDTLEQLKVVLRCDVDVVLLDNMSCDEMRAAVEMRDAAGVNVALEASGGVNMESVRDICKTGVERIAIGGLTHSAVAMDIGLDLEV